MNICRIHLFIFLLVLLLCSTSVNVFAQTDTDNTTTLFDKYQDKLYQIRTINRVTDAKLSIGSGFQVDANGLIVTNFHVVSEYVHDQELNRLEYIDSNGDKGELEVISVDVINDLALVAHSNNQSEYLQLSDSLPTQGAPIYSLGNPHDVGQIVAPGVYNGYIENSYYERLHFTGSLNSGVSGGPVLNSAGDVIGVNVASSGNQLSYLVPLDKVRALIASKENIDSNTTLQESIRRQLDDHQNRIMDDLMSVEWPRVSMGDAVVYGEPRSYIRCWDASEEPDKEKRYNFNKTICSNSDYIYLSKNLESGEYQFFYYWLQSDTLNALQFSSLYKNKLPSFSINTFVTEDDVTNFECKSDFVGSIDLDKESLVKTVFCARVYKDYPELYDVLFIAESSPKNNKALVAHFTLAGVGKESAIKFTEKFVRGITWP